MRTDDLCELDESGRRSSEAIKGSEFRSGGYRYRRTVTGAKLADPGRDTKIFGSTRGNYIFADEETGGTQHRRRYAGGDIVTGSATLAISAMRHHLKAQRYNEYLLRQTAPRA
jgi:NADPH-dependent glutamate synthase beta subunit-like oxidoreductase